MPSLAQYYGHAKTSVGEINPKDMAQLGEDYLVVAATGAGVGMMSAMLGGLDKQVLGFPVPLDGVASLVLGYAGLAMKGDTGKALKIASIAAGGSAAIRTFEGFFKKGFGVKGELEDFSNTGMPGYQGAFGPTFAFGQSAQDRLVQSARYL
jgi:hypothetical protein